MELLESIGKVTVSKNDYVATLYGNIHITGPLGIINNGLPITAMTPTGIELSIALGNLLKKKVSDVYEEQFGEELRKEKEKKTIKAKIEFLRKTIENAQCELNELEKMLK